MSASGRALELLAVSPPPVNCASVAAEINLEALRGPQNRPSSPSWVLPSAETWEASAAPVGSEIANGGSFAPACVQTSVCFPATLGCLQSGCRLFVQALPDVFSLPDLPSGRFARRDPGSPSALTDRPQRSVLRVTRNVYGGRLEAGFLPFLPWGWSNHAVLGSVAPPPRESPPPAQPPGMRTLEISVW